MLIDVPPAGREALRPLFTSFPGLHGCLDAVLDGSMGTARVDDLPRPSVALLYLDFHFLAGDPEAPAAADTVRTLEPPWFLNAAPGWEPLLRRIWGDALAARRRVDFAAPAAWDRGRLRSFLEALRPAFELKRIDIGDAPRFAELAESLVYNFESLEDFVARGAGFGIEREGRFVSGCSSFAISRRCLEFEIQTHPDFRRRGLATAAAAAMIEHCLDRGLGPCWDAHNEVSAALATKLGFVEPRPYTAYEVLATAAA